MAQKRESGKLVAENRKARFNFAIEDTLEAGLVLTGSEVKSLRAGKANIGDAYASDEGGGALYLINAHIAEYAQSGRNTHEPTRPRKLLMHKRELDRLTGAIQRQGMTVVPLKLYFNARGHRQGPARPRQGQEAARQARDREEARLGPAEGPPDARQGVGGG